MHISKDEQPLVSVIMGVCNQRQDTVLLERAIRSIQEQTYRQLELIICQWRSTSSTCELLERMAAEDRRIKLIDGNGAETLAAKLNRCIEIAQGDWIARMDDDDYSHPKRIERQMMYLESHPDVSFCGCNVNLCMGENLTACGQRTFPEFPTVRDFYMTQPYIHPTLVFRRDILDSIKGYSEGKYQVLCEDYDLLLRLYQKGWMGANLQEYLLDYSIPLHARGKRTMHHRVNEVVTRWNRFRDLERLPQALPYVIKPIVVGLLPEKILQRIKNNGAKH